MSYYVSCPLVVATTEDGTQRYVYEGATVPSDVPAEEIRRLADEGLINEIAAEQSDDEAKPRDKWTVKELQAYAGQHSVDLGDAKLKDEILAAIEKAEQAPA